MSIRSAMAALGAALLACRPTPTVEPTPPPPPDDTTRAAPPSPIGQGTARIVRPGATVWLDRTTARPVSLPAALAVRVIEDVGDRVEIETDAAASCPQQPLRDLRLRMFVARADLLDPVACGEQSPPSSPEPTDGRATHQVRAGVVVHWRDGTEAGVVARDHVVRGQASVAGTQTCLPYALAPGNELTLCVPSDAVVTRAAPIPVAEHRNALGGPENTDDDDTFGGLLGGAAPDDGGSSGLGKLAGAREPIKPIVEHGKPSVVGKLDRDIVRRIVRRHHNHVALCYGFALQEDPKAKGRASLRFTIDAEGNVRDAALEDSTIDSEAMRLCMVEVAALWRFPKPVGGEVEVTYPFTFDPG